MLYSGQAIDAGSDRHSGAASAVRHLLDLCSFVAPCEARQRVQRPCGLTLREVPTVH